MFLKTFLKRSLQTSPTLWEQILRIWRLRHYWYDIRGTYRSMFWPTNSQDWKILSSGLLYNYHALEKGLVMPEIPRLFGVERAVKVIEFLTRWRKAGFDETNPVFVGAIETLRSYADKIQAKNLDPDGIIMPRVLGALALFPQRDESLRTPQSLPCEINLNTALLEFTRLAYARRSVRNFEPRMVEREKISVAIKLAQLSPSVCNRQPCVVYLVSDPEKMLELLSFQTGNRGFGHLVPLIAIITVDERCFVNALERHEPYIDGGLFTMSFTLALSAQGLASCCLNWCVDPKKDAEVHRRFNIPRSQRIIMLIAIGYPPDNCVVPRSARRELSEVLIDLQHLLQ